MWDYGLSVNQLDCSSLQGWMLEVVMIEGVMTMPCWMTAGLGYLLIAQPVSKEIKI